MPTWNPWHGCHKLSEGCLNCYVYRIDSRHGRTSSVVLKTADFDLPSGGTAAGRTSSPRRAGRCSPAFPPTSF